MLVPEHEIVPGEEQWHPAVCTECAAGCGTIVRVMEGVRTVERNGEQVRERIGGDQEDRGQSAGPSQRRTIVRAGSGGGAGRCTIPTACAMR